MLIPVSTDNILAGFASYAGWLGAVTVKLGVETLNTLGPQARREMVDAEARATGLSTRILGRALHETRATAETPACTISSAGGEIGLYYFGAEVTREGVSARLLGERKVFAGTFMKAGSFTKGRITKPGWNSQVFRRGGTQTDGFRPGTERPMDRFEKVRSGVVIPREMVRGEPLRAFEAVSAGFPGVVLKRLTGTPSDGEAGAVNHP